MADIILHTSAAIRYPLGAAALRGGRMEDLPRKLAKHVAIVTGAGRGMGGATALPLARMGAPTWSSPSWTAPAPSGRPRRSRGSGAAATLDITEEHWDSVLDINARKPPLQRQQDSGHQHDKRLALAHGTDGIRVDRVCPGFVETDMWTQGAREQGALLGLSPEEFTRRRVETLGPRRRS